MQPNSAGLCGIAEALAITATATATPVAAPATPVPPTPTPTPLTTPTVEVAAVEATPAPQPCWMTDADTGEILYAEDGTPVPCAAAPVEVQPAPEVPVQLPNTGDPQATDACATATDPEWWQFVGAVICG